MSMNFVVSYMEDFQLIFQHRQTDKLTDIPIYFHLRFSRQLKINFFLCKSYVDNFMLIFSCFQSHKFSLRIQPGHTKQRHNTE